MEHAVLERQSMMVDGRWCDAAWAVEMVDGESGELTISVSQIGFGGKGMALRMSMELARRLRAMATNGAEQLAPDGSRVLCCDCRTTGERLTELEEAIQADIQERFADREQLHSLANRLDALEDAVKARAMRTELQGEKNYLNERLDLELELIQQIAKQLEALESQAEEARQERALADAEDEMLLTVDMMAVYDMIARRQRAAGGK